LLGKGVQNGDIVTIYMPMIPELAMTMLACARIGAVHSVVFAGFSAEALGQRISAAKSKHVVTADIGRRGGKTIGLKDIVNDALTKLDCNSVVEHVMVWERFYNAESSASAPYEMKDRDIRMDPLVAVQRPYCPPVHMDSEDNLFILYTSGSTGNRKLPVKLQTINVLVCYYARLSHLCDVSVYLGYDSERSSTYNRRIHPLCENDDSSDI
jgi:acetyl-CoA synthetase